MQKDKITAIASWKQPLNIEELRSFLGAANYCHKFIDGYARTAAPLNDLLKKDVSFSWNDEAEQAFEALKKLMTEAPVLKVADTDKPFKVTTDASNKAIGAVLTQDDEDGSSHPVAYIF